MAIQLGSEGTMRAVGVALMILGGTMVAGGLASGRDTLLRTVDVRSAATGSSDVPASPIAGVIPFALGVGMILRDSRRVE
jgi:hypothetical protein